MTLRPPAGPARADATHSPSGRGRAAQTRRSRAGAPQQTGTALRGDSAFPTSTAGLSNARTRIVGDRTGWLADAIITAVRVATLVGGAIASGWRRVAAVVTPLGWTLAAVVPVALVAGYALDWIELVVAGVACAVLLALAALYLVGKAALDIRLEVNEQRVVVGQSAEGEVVVTNRRRSRALGISIEVPVGAGLAELALPGLRTGATHRHRFSIPTVRRGVVPVGPVRTVRADPLGLVRRETVWTERAELFVHPRTIGIASMSTGLVRDLEGNPTRDLTASDIAFHALREYSPGDDRRYIHWKSTAKTGTYMVRQFEETRRSHLVIALSLASSDYATDEEFELAVSVTGSLGARAIRDSRAVSVVVGERTPEFAKRKVFAVRPLSTLNRSRLLDDLALVEHTATSLPLPDVARVSGAQVSGISVAFLVCGSVPGVAELRAAASRFPPGIEVVAVVCDVDAAPELRRVAGLTVLTVGYLEDLSKSLARSAAV